MTSSSRRRHRHIELRRTRLRARAPHALRRRSTSTVACASLGLILMLSGMGMHLRQQAERVAYDKLGNTVVITDRRAAARGQAASQDDALDWESLRTQNDEVAAWVHVEGIDLSLPVVAPRDGDMAYYLGHDFWRNDSFEGTPFLDHRSDADGVHRLTYGHHLSSGGQFSDLQHAWMQEEFDRLGTCHWHTPQAADTHLTPLCAAKVDLWHATIQQFDFTEASKLRAWLTTLATNSSARNRASERLIAKAKSAVTLVTCASDIGNQDWRTITTFVET